MSLASSGKGKAAESSTNWSDWAWDHRGFWYSSRLDSKGEPEWDYRYPESGLGQEVPRYVVPSAFSDGRSDTCEYLPGYHLGSTTSTHRSPEPLESQTSPIARDDGELQYSGSSSFHNHGVPVARDYGKLQYPSSSYSQNHGVPVAQSLQNLRISSSEIVDGAKIAWQDFEAIIEPSRFFKVGRVFKTMWSEPAGDVADADPTFLSTPHSGGTIYTKVRHFVVVREMLRHSLCVQLSTHGGRGVAKFGGRTEDYAPVYPAGGDLSVSPDERLTKPGFPIVVENPSIVIDPMSRLNFGKVYTVEHNVKVQKVGRVSPEYLEILQENYVQTITGLGKQDSQVTTSRYHNPLSAVRYGSVAPDLPAIAARSCPSPPAFSPTFIRREPGSSDWEALDNRYRVVPSKQSSKFWKVGRVFMMLWTEPVGQRMGDMRNGSHISTVMYGGEVFTEVRRFVVLQNNYGSVICSAIHTYSGMATLKLNLPNPAAHAIIHTSKNAPSPHSIELRDGTARYEQLVIDPIKVTGGREYPEGQLHPLSRINFTKLYTVEKDVRVLNIGVINDQHSLSILEEHAGVKVWDVMNDPVKPPSQTMGRFSGETSPPVSQKGPLQVATRSETRNNSPSRPAAETQEVAESAQLRKAAGRVRDHRHGRMK